MTRKDSFFFRDRVEIGFTQSVCYGVFYIDEILKKLQKNWRNYIFRELIIKTAELSIKTAELSIKTAELILIPQNKH